MRRPLHAIAVAGALALALVLTACSSSPDDEPAASTPGSTAAESTAAPNADADVGEALEAFVEAAGRGDVADMWDFLASATKERLGPTEEDFERRYGKDFQTGLGSFAGTDYELVVSASMPSGWGIAAIAGNRVRDEQQEFAAYGAAFRREDGWKLVLNDPVAIRNLAPPGTTTDDRRPQIGVRITADAAIDEAGLWLDGSPLPADVRATDGRDIRVEGVSQVELAPGWHVIVAFGRAGDLASAAARPFQVDTPGDGGPVA